MKRLITVLFVMVFSYSWAQEPWLYENSYYGFQILESYDGGTLILANADGQTHEPKLFKLSKSGDLLWEHSFEENISTMPGCMAEDSSGNIIVGGKTFRFQSEYADGFLLKLNPCGELIWFKALYDYVIYNYVNSMIIDENDNIIITDYNNNSNDGENFEDTTLKKYSSDGELLWSSVLLPENESDPREIINCSDGGYLISANFYRPPYYDLDHNVFYVRSTHVKTDSLGNIQWVHVFRWEEDTPEEIKSSVEGKVVEIVPNKFIAIASDYTTGILTPLFYLMDVNGNSEWVKDISETDKVYGSRELVHDSNSNLILGINVANSDFENKHLEIHKYDSLGNTLNQWANNVETSVLRDFRWNRDSTSLYVLPGTKLSTLSLYAFKFNTNSMQLDTFATEDNNEYDYYCPEGVVDLNFEFPVLSIVEQPEVIKEQIKIAPNPAKNFTYLYFDITDYNRSAKLEIYNMQGALMKSYPLQAAIGRVKEDLSSYPKGVYAVSLIVNDRLVESSKMVVE